MVLADDRRAGLERIRLGALVADLTGRRCDPMTVGASTTSIDDGTAFTLLPDTQPSALAGALTWALRHDADRSVLFVDDLGGDLARMAAYFRMPVEVRAVQRSSSVAVEPAPLPEPVPVVTDPELEAQLRAAGLEVVEEDGVVRGEIRGLEVARLVTWPVETGGDGLVHLEAGVGRFDRDATAAMHQGEPPTTTLARSVATVAAQRVAGAGIHPLARLARERWLRRSLVETPALVGAEHLDPAETTIRRDSVRDVTPAAATGTAVDGSPLVVLCSTGVDLSLVPVAADTRAWLEPTAHLVLAVPGRDRLAALDALNGLLIEPGEILTVPEPWAETSADATGLDPR